MPQVGRGLRSRSADSRAAAVEALDTLGDKQLVKQIIPLLKDAQLGERFSSEAALRQCLASNDAWLRDALYQMNELNAMETLPTMSVMERVLLLHEVPLFAALSPDDLSQIADIARGQWYDDGSLICP